MSPYAYPTEPTARPPVALSLPLELSKMTDASKTLCYAIHGAGLFNRYDSDRGRDATSCAERNLDGRTHYVSADTRRFHKSRISKAVALDNGLIFGIVESCAANYENTRRVYRPVFFDLDGHVIARPDLDASPRTGAAAVKLFWKMANELDAVAVTRAMLERRAATLRRDLAALETVCAAI